METFKYLIVDESPPGAASLMINLSHCSNENEIFVGIVTSENKATQLIETLHPDIIFLNLMGYEEFKNGLREKIRINGYNPEIVYFSQNPTNSVEIKPILKEDNCLIIEPEKLEELKNCLSHITHRVIAKRKTISSLSRLGLTGIKGPILVNPEKLAFLEADGHYTNIYMNKPEHEIVCQGISCIVNLLPNSSFFRADRSTVINLNWLESVNIKRKSCTLRYGSYSFQKILSPTALNRLLKKIENINL